MHMPKYSRRAVQRDGWLRKRSQFEMIWRNLVMRLTSGALACVALGFAIGLGARGEPPAQSSTPAVSIDQCTNQALSLIKSSPVDVDLLASLRDYCYSRAHGDGLLNDFAIRRLKFLQQAYDERILLWMVVALTMGGVGLAALQMVTSYRLSADGRAAGVEGPTEFSLERGRIALKSSVTGLFVLIFSFAFFYVFVFEIYKIKDVNPDSIDQSARASFTPGLMAGASASSEPRSDRSTPDRRKSTQRSTPP